MVRKNNNRDSENNHSANNNDNSADTRGNGNTTKQAGRDIIEGNKYLDEGRVKTDPFNIFSELSRSIGSVLFRLGIGDRLERLSLPAGAVAGAFFLTIFGNNAYTAFDFDGAIGTALSVIAYIYSQVSGPLLETLTNHLGVGIILTLVAGLPIWYTIEKYSSTCTKCDRPFAAMTRTIEYPSRSTVDGEGNRHVPVDRDRFCIYCDGDVEDDTPDGGESSPQVMADGGDAGACCCSCHKED